MPNSMDVEPEDLRNLAEQHDLAAENIRKWGEVPTTWLADFKQSYGPLAEPVQAALADYYDRRHARANRLANNHQRTRDELRATADALEDADRKGHRQISQAGDEVSNAPHAGPAPSPGAVTDPTPAVTNQPHLPQQPSVTPSSISDAAGDRHTPESTELRAEADRSTPWLPPTTPTPQTEDTTAPAAFIPPPGAATSSDAAEPGAAHNPATPAVDTNGPPGATDRTTPTLPTAGPLPIAVPPGGMDSTNSVSSSPLPPDPTRTATHASRDGQELASFVAGEPLDDDLALARALLAAVLAASSNSAPDLEWATAVLRTARGPVALITSTEGRGWLPPGLFLPRAVTLPWRWDHILDAEERNTATALEDSADPARILTEFGIMALRHRPVRISALTSSTVVPDGLRTALGAEISVQDQISAAESIVDFTSPAQRLIDRLAIAAPKKFRRQATSTPDSDIRATCLELARAADAQIRSTVFTTDTDSTANRDQRKRILDALRTRRSIPTSWWDELKAVDRRQAELLTSQRVDSSFATVGARADDAKTETRRPRVFERRANELLLLAESEPHRQTVRDAFYTYSQIVEHPSFTTAGRVATRQPRSDTDTAPMDTRVTPDVNHAVTNSNSASVVSTGFDETPPSIAELLQDLSVSKDSGEQREA